MRDPTCNRCGSETAYTQINANDGYCDACALHRAKGRAAAPPLPEGEPAPHSDSPARGGEVSPPAAVPITTSTSGHLSAAPAPGVVLSEDVRRALTSARECLANSMMRTADYERVAAILDGILSQPSPRPATLSVGAALMLPEVRDGAMHVSFDYSGDPVVLKAVAGDPHIFWTDDRGYSWEEWSPEPDELLLPCTLIPSPETP